MRRFLALFIVLILSGVLAFAQNRVVTGRVTDDKGTPIENATIKVKGTNKGTSADQNGNFTISAATGATLIISSAEITTKEVTVGQGTVNVTVVRSGKELSTVVITTALGIRRQAKSLGYSTAKVNSDELNQAKVTNIATGLAAKVSGLQVN